MIKINGEVHSYNGEAVEDLLKALGYNLERIAVELNCEILPKAEYKKTLQAGDSLEVVTFVGGG